MLIFKRYENQAFWVGQVRIKIDEIKGNKVKVSIDAPAGIEVLRDELIAQRAGPAVPQDENLSGE